MKNVQLSIEALESAIKIHKEKYGMDLDVIIFSISEDPTIGFDLQYDLENQSVELGGCKECGNEPCTCDCPICNG